jgi:hypothetical protein
MKLSIPIPFENAQEAARETRGKARMNPKRKDPDDGFPLDRPQILAGTAVYLPAAVRKKKLKISLDIPKEICK